MAKNKTDFEEECERKGLKVYRYDGGRQAVGCKPDSCLVCKHCTDVFWDYTHGPYTLNCEYHNFPDCIDQNGRATCDKFEEE